MKQIDGQDQIDEMRKRLYDRGNKVEADVRHELSDIKVDVTRNWDIPDDSADGAEAEEAKPKRHYRSFLLIGSLLIFIVAAVTSGLYMMYGGNQISNDNIQIVINGPSVIGGGEKLSLQVAVSNQNTVPIEAATLIIKYPTGTRSGGDIPRNLFEERIPIENLEPGDIQNVPISVIIFGEENLEKKIEATVEYRVNGSNGVFYKDAKELAFRINSSPLVLRVDNIEKVASGQLVELTLTAVSNASTPLSDILVTASYPNGFSYESSSPVPIYGQNVWHIEELLPEESSTIKVKGVVSGLTEETFRINFTAGPANPDNQYLVGATLAEGSADYIIERPFIDVDISIDGDTSRDVILAEGMDSDVTINIKNTLDETVYDMAVEVVPGGNALNEESIKSRNGFYDSNTGSVRWEAANNSSFGQILPGDSRSISLTVDPGPVRTTASYDLVVNIYARRVAETSAVESLIGTIKAEAKYSSSMSLSNQVDLKSGPVPPKVGETTFYTLTMVAEAGANDITDTILETSLPLHVSWLDEYDAEGKVTYNSVSKKLQWEAGDISSGQRKDMTFEVSTQPSLSQVGTSPVLLNSQSVRANDRFTGALLQDKASAVTTRLSREQGYTKEDGEVTR